MVCGPSGSTHTMESGPASCRAVLEAGEESLQTQRLGRADHVRAVPASVEARHPVGVPAMGSLEVAGPPMREAQQARRPATAEVVVRLGEIERSCLDVSHARDVLGQTVKLTRR